MTLEAFHRPAAAEPEGALVLFHGRGADQYDLVALLDALDPDRRLDGYTPRGPFPFPPGGAHWYLYAEVGHPDPPTFWEGLEAAAGWLDGLGLPPEKVVIGGFSQGAVMSYALALGRGRPRPAALIALSGFVPNVPGFELDLSLPLPPIAIGHGDQDPVISVQWGRRAHDLLPLAFYRESPMGHSIDPRFLRDLAGWLGSVFPPPKDVVPISLADMDQTRPQYVIGSGNPNVGDQVEVFGDDERSPGWLEGRESIRGTLLKWIPGRNQQLACVIELEQPLTASGLSSGSRQTVTGRYLILRRRRAGLWKPSGTVNVELCESIPDNWPFGTDQRGTWIDSHGWYRLLEPGAD